MPITPLDSPSGEPAAELDTGERKEPGTGERPPITPTPNVSIAPAPPPAADCHEAPTPPDDGRSGMVLTGEVFDLGEGGRYTVKECLGRGGMGEVYLAEHVTPHAKGVVNLVALKVLRPDAHPRHARDFTDEVRLLSLLRHKHIAGFRDFFVDKGRQVLVMEYVEGRSLHAILDLARRKGRKLTEATSLELLAQVANALGYAHAAKDEEGCPLNIVHRDVSPSNIMVSSAGYAVLMDFGVAKADLEEQTQTGSDFLSIRGKPAYVAPEQVLMQPVDGRADLFALGSILVEMQTGEPPFGRTADVGTLLSTALVSRGKVDNLTRGLSEKVRAICRKALAFDPSRRFVDGDEMAAAMLADLPSRGPEAVKEEIAALEALPDAPSEAVERVERSERDLRRVTGRRRAAEVIAALVCAAGACFFLWSAYSSEAGVGAILRSHAARANRDDRHAIPEERTDLGLRAVHPDEESRVPEPTEIPEPSGGKPKKEESPAVASGPARQRSVLAADEPQKGKKESERGSSPHGAERQGGDAAVEGGRLAAASTPPSTASTNASADAASLGRSGEPQVAALKEQLATVSANYDRLYGEATSPDHAVAGLLAARRADLTSYFLHRRRKLQVRGLSAEVQIFVPWKAGGASKVAVVVELTNPNDAPAWELREAQIEPVPYEGAEPSVTITQAMVVKPVALRALPRVLSPGQKGRVALVFDRTSAGLDKVDGMAKMLELLRNGQVEFAVELYPDDVQDSRSALERWLPW